LARFVNIFQDVLESIFLHECLVPFVELQSAPSVFDRVMFGSLYVLLEQEPRQKAQREPTMARGIVKNGDGIDHLGRRNEDVCRKFLE